MPGQLRRCLDYEILADVHDDIVNMLHFKR